MKSVAWLAVLVAVLLLVHSLAPVVVVLLPVEVLVVVVSLGVQPASLYLSAACTCRWRSYILGTCCQADAAVMVPSVVLCMR